MAKQITIAGTPIAKYKIVYGKSLDAALELQKYLALASGRQGQLVTFSVLPALPVFVHRKYSFCRYNRKFSYISPPGCVNVQQYS